MPHQILISEHDAHVRKALAEYLQGTLGYGVTCVAGGQEAIEAAISRQYDLFILGIDGPDEAEASTRLHKLNPDLQAIFLTKAGEQEAIQDFLRFSMPADRVLVKPLGDMSALTRLIVSILGPPTA